MKNPSDFLDFHHKLVSARTNLTNTKDKINGILQDEINHLALLDAEYLKMCGKEGE